MKKCLTDIKSTTLIGEKEAKKSRRKKAKIPDHAITPRIPPIPQM